VRRRAKRDLITLSGVCLILAAIVGFNLWLKRDSLREQYEKMRLAKEEEVRAGGFKVLEWEMFREIEGRRIPTFPESLKAHDTKPVNLCGFMAPIDQFSDVTEFMLLPVPMTCYFCEAPPMRDIVHVKLAESGKMVEEPIVVGGWLELAKEKKPKFFSTISPATWNEAIDTEALEKYSAREISEKHKKHLIMGFGKFFDDENAPELQGGFEPAAKSDDEDALLEK
jgi:hypothetical protein